MTSNLLLLMFIIIYPYTSSVYVDWITKLNKLIDTQNTLNDNSDDECKNVAN